VPYPGRVLTIDHVIHEAIIAHAGPIGADRPTRHIPMANAERSPTFYRFDSAEQFKVWREMDDRDEEPIIIYHSHSATEAYPSRTDISYASEPGAHYVLISTRDADGLGDFQFRSFRILDAVVYEEDVNVLGSAEAAAGPA
jgi:proteasome lid subunit RPN8/RPN11